jgi:hypothetical protein
VLDEKKVEKTLVKCENWLRQVSGHEEGYVVRMDGKCIGRVVGDKDTPFLGNFIKDYILTHNHPRGTCKLSIEDIGLVLEHGAYEIRAVVNSGKYVSLKRGAGELDSEGFLKAIDGAKWKKLFPDEANKWMYDNAIKYGYLFDGG